MNLAQKEQEKYLGLGEVGWRNGGCTPHIPRYTDRRPRGKEAAHFCRTSAAFLLLSNWLELLMVEVARETERDRIQTERERERVSVWVPASSWAWRARVHNGLDSPAQPKWN